MENTSIAVSKASKKKWEQFKNHNRESFEDMFNRILKSQSEEDQMLLTQEDILDIKRSILEIEEGKFKTLEQMKSKYNLK